MSDQFLVCPACQAKNRTPSERLSQSPKCGQCKAVLLPAQPLELNGVSLARLLANETLPLVVDFWAPWCGPCQQMAPVFTAAADEFVGKLRLAKVDTQAHQAVGGKYGIRSIPTLVAFAQGKEVARQSGAMSAGQLRQWLQGL